jgi:hypothetical protein
VFSNEVNEMSLGISHWGGEEVVSGLDGSNVQEGEGGASTSDGSSSDD